MMGEDPTSLAGKALGAGNTKTPETPEKAKEDGITKKDLIEIVAAVAGRSSRTDDELDAITPEKRPREPLDDALMSAKT